MFSLFQLRKKRNVKSDLDEREIGEIKKFFFESYGDEMSMHRRDPMMFCRYCAVSDDIVAAWRQELIAKEFEVLSSNANLEYTWITTRHLLHLISASRAKQKDNYKRLLMQMIDMVAILDKRQRILILEHFAGRTSHQCDGGIYKITTKTNLTELLTRAIDVLADFQTDESDNFGDLGWADMGERFSAVKDSIQRAYEKFGIKRK